jgi:hypothetical protein
VIESSDRAVGEPDARRSAWLISVLGSDKGSGDVLIEFSTTRTTPLVCTQGTAQTVLDQGSDTHTRAMSLEQALYKKHQFRAADPFRRPVRCLDVFSKAKRSLLQRMATWVSGSPRPLTPLGSMLNVKMMADDSKWRSEDVVTLDSLRASLEELKDATVEDLEGEVFNKDSNLRKLTVDFSNSKGGVLWLSGVTGLDLGKDAMLSATMGDLTIASVDYLTICDWIEKGYWRPDRQLLQVATSDWSEYHK